MNIIQNGLFKTLFLFSILYCFSLFLYGEPLPAGPPPYEYSWMVCKEKVEGNQKGYLIKLTSLLLKNPNSPYAPLVVDEMSRVLGNQGRNEFAFQTVKLLLNQEIQNGYVYVKLLELYSDLLKKHGKKENLKKRGLFRGYLRKWQILGPFGKVGSSLLYQSFPVENDQQFASLDMKKSYQGAFGEVHWQPFVVKKDNWIAPGSRIKPNRGCIYAVTHIYFPQSQAFILQLDPAPLMKLWINGKLAYQSKTHFSRNISRIRIPLKLPKGWSRFFVKLAPTSSYSNYSSFRIRFLNRKGFPLSLNISHLAFHPYSKYGFKIYTGPLQPWPLKYFQNKAKANQSFWAKVALSWLETFHGKSPKAIYRLEKLMNIGKENPYFLYIYIQALRRASFISDHIFQNKALKLYQKCEGLDPSFHLASLLFKINYLSRQGKSAKAYRLITQELKSCKYPLALLISGMNICDNEEWLPQALEFAQKGLKISPYHPAFLQFMEKYYRNLGNLKKAKEYIRKRILFYGSSQDKDYWKYEEYMNKGEHAKALALLKKLIEKYPKKSLYWEGLYQYYLNHENFEKALETYIHLQRIKGDGPSPSGDYYYNLGRLALLAGRKEEAINYYKAYLNKEPDNINLRFFLAYLQKKPWDYSKDYEIKIDPFIEKAKKLSYPKAHSMVLVDQTVVKIWKDGSVSETVHMAHKILDEEGKNKYHTIYPNGEILQLRTIDPKGKVWEPIMPDQGSIVPPALMIGSVIEQKYRRNQSGSYPFQFRWGPFFFKDPNYDEPVLFSQLVVILEKGAPFKIFTHKIDEKRKKIINKGNFNIYIWTFEKQDRTEIERFMPPPKEILPYVAIYSNQSFLNHLWKTLESYGPQIEPTPQIEEASQKILGSQKRTDLDKIKALYQYVQKAIPKGYGDGRYGNALRILMEKEGDRGVLFQSLLLAAKIDFAPAFAFPPKNPVLYEITEIQQNLSRQSSFLLRVYPKGAEPLWIYLGIRNLPIGKIPPSLQGGQAYVFRNGQFHLTFLPKEGPKKEASQTIAKLRITEKGDLKGIFTLVLPGSQGARIKEFVKNRPTYWRKNVVESILNRFYPGARVIQYAFLNLQDPGKDLKVQAHFFISRYVEKRGNLYRVRLGIQPLFLTRVFGGKARRVHPILFTSSSKVFSRISLRLAPNWGFAKVPSSIVLERKMGKYFYQTRWEEKELSIQRNFMINPFRLPSKDFKKLLKWCQLIDQQERKAVFIQRIP